ncbi:hypothetical protein [Sphingomonas sp.]|nr:hypothetical protein [Sphingomonas sp.]
MRDGIPEAVSLPMIAGLAASDAAKEKAMAVVMEQVERYRAG